MKSQRPSRFLISLVAVTTGLALFALWVRPAWAAVGDTTRLSVSSSGEQADADSSRPSISADGRYVAWNSIASNLVGGDTNGFTDIFVRDVLGNATSRVSVASDGTQGNNYSDSPSISGDGRYVAFDSGATNLVSGDTNLMYDIFVHDALNNSTQRVSVSSSGAQANGRSFFPHISADGRYVMFDSEATNLVSGDTNGYQDVFVRDLVNNTTTRISVSSAGQQANRESLSKDISADGRYLLFSSPATNLAGVDANYYAWDVYVRDQQAGSTVRVSVSSSGVQGNLDSYASSISADGRHVALASLATNLVDGDNNGYRDVFVYDFQTAATTRLSVSANGVEGNQNSYGGSISADGRYVTFASQASNLVEGDANNLEDVIVYDRQIGKASLVSLDSNGLQATGGSDENSISADGHYLVFASIASNLVPGDTNMMKDLFLHEMDLTPPTTTGIADVAVTQDAPDTTIDLWPSFADVDNPDGALTYTVMDNTDPALFTSVAAPAPGGQYLVLDYAPAALGTAVLTVRASDPAGLSVVTSFSVTIAPVPTDTPTAIPSETPTSTPTDTPTDTPPPTPSDTPTSIATDTATPTVTFTDTPTEVPSPTATFTPAPTETASTLHVGDLDATAGWSVMRKWTATVTVTVHDTYHNPLQGAVVTGSWSGGYSGSATCTTDDNGQCSLNTPKLNNSRTSVTFTVTTIQDPLLAYLAADNHDPDGDSGGTWITVLQP
jgi:WD40 repeat protein